MADILEATAENGKVTAGGSEVPGVSILSSGKAKSSGYLILEKDKKVYVAIPIESITQTLDLLKSALSKITMASLGVPVQGWATPPTLPNDLMTATQEIDKLKDNLQ